MTSNPRIQVGVVGAGIAGLAAAIALRRANCDVEVFERSSFKNEIGAAVTISPNSARVLDHWGFDADRARATENLQLKIRLGVTLDEIYADAYGHLEDVYGHKNWSFHRVDLHDGLRRLATESDDSKGPPARIRLASKVTGLDCENGELTLVKGDKIRKDLVIVADGAHCSFIKEVIGVDIPMSNIGRSAFRCLIPFDRIRADPDTWALFESEPPGFLATALPATNIFAMSYPCRSGEILNYAILHDTPEDQQGAQGKAVFDHCWEKAVSILLSRTDWNSPASIEDVLACVKDMHPTIKKLLRMTDEVKVFTLMHRPPLDRLTRGKVALIGDAAHNMLPTHGQGTAVALEDAAAFEVLFSGLEDPGRVKERLQVFEKLRLPRGALTQIISNAGLGRHAVPEVEKEIRRFYDGTLPPPGAMPYSKPFRDLFFGYNIFEEAKRGLK